MSAPQRPPNNDRGLVYFGMTLLTLALAFVGVLQLGHWLTSGEWLPANPIDAAVQWYEQGLEWSPWHTAAAVLAGLLLTGAVVLAVLWFRSRARAREHIDEKAQYMGKGETMTLKQVITKNDAAGYTAHETVGQVLGENVRTGKELWAGWRSTVTAIMGPGSAKTSALAVPPTLNAPGWVYGTSNKRDYTDCVWDPRAAVGDMKVFDVQNIADVEPTWWWNPLSYITGPEADTKAKIQATLFYEAAKDPNAKVDGFFTDAGLSLVGNLLLAASIAGEPITACMQWVTKPNVDLPVGILRAAADDAGKPLWPLALASLISAYELNVETKRGVFANATGVLSFLFNQAALRWVCSQGPDDERPQFSPAAFVRSKSDTLISLSKEGVGSLSPLVAALTMAVTEAAEDYAKTCKGGRLPVPGCVILDEAANVARIKNLPDLYSHYGSRGIFILTFLQSRAQGRAAWGRDGMDKMLGASTHRIYGRGIDEVDLLRDLSTLIGPHDVKEWTGGDSGPGMFGGGHRSRSTNWAYRSKPIMEPAVIAAMPEWRCLVMASGDKPVLARLIPYWERSPEMKTAVDASKAAHEPAGLLTV